MDSDGRLPPVGMIYDLEPVDHPQFIPGSPHNLPPRRDRPNRRGYLGLSGSSLVDDGLPPEILPPGTPTAGPGAGEGQPVIDPHHYAYITEGQFNAGLISLRMIEESPTKRNYLMIRNTSATAVIFVSFGRDATSVSPVRLSSNQMMLLDAVVPQDDVYVLSDTAATVVAYAYSTIA